MCQLLIMWSHLCGVSVPDVVESPSSVSVADYVESPVWRVSS